MHWASLACWQTLTKLPPAARLLVTIHQISSEIADFIIFTIFKYPMAKRIIDNDQMTTHHFLELLLGLCDPLPVVAVHNKDQALAKNVNVIFSPVP